VNTDYPPCFTRGVILYTRGMYWHAHEAWETCWRQARGAERALLRALIQISAAMIHQSRRNVRGMQALLGRAADNLEGLEGRVLGLSVEHLRHQIQTLLDGSREPAVRPGMRKIRIRPAGFYGIRCERINRHPADMPMRTP